MWARVFAQPVTKALVLLLEALHGCLSSSIGWPELHWQMPARLGFTSWLMESRCLVLSSEDSRQASRKLPPS